MEIEKLPDYATESTDGTSFHGDVVYTTVEILREAFGDPTMIDEDVNEKVQYEWCLELSDGTPCTLYDWKEYRCYEETATIEFHIGAHGSTDSLKALGAIKQKIKKVL